MPNEWNDFDDFTYEKAVKKMLELGGLWIVRQSPDDEKLKMLCHYDYAPHFPGGTKVFRLKSFNGQLISYSNYDVVRHMTPEEMAKWVTSKGRYFGEEYEGYMSCLDWLYEEAEENDC